VTEDMPALRPDQYEEQTIEIIRELTRDWDTGYDGEITRDSRIVADLSFESLDVVHMVTAIEQKFECRELPFEQLLMEDGHYVDDLSVGRIAEFLHKQLGQTAS